jgi:hypothetical protein
MELGSLPHTLVLHGWDAAAASECCSPRRRLCKNGLCAVRIYVRFTAADGAVGRQTLGPLNMLL